MNQISPLLLRHVMSAAVATPPTAERDDIAEPDFLLTLGTIMAADTGADQASAADEEQFPTLSPPETTLNQRQICAVRTWRNTLDFDAPPSPTSTVFPGLPTVPEPPGSDALPPGQAEILASPRTVPPTDADQSPSGGDALTGTHEALAPDSASEARASAVTIPARSSALAVQAARPAGGNAMLGAVPSIANNAADVPVSTPDDVQEAKAVPSPAVATAATGPSTFSVPPVDPTRWGEDVENAVTGTEAEPGAEIPIIPTRETQGPGISPTPMIWPNRPPLPAASSAPGPKSGEIQASTVALPLSAPHPGTTAEDSGYPQLPHKPAQAQDAAKQLPATDDGGAETAAMERGFPHAQGGLRADAGSRNGASRTANDPVVTSPAPPPTAQSRNADSGLHSDAVTPKDALASAPAPDRRADPAVSVTFFDSSGNRYEGIALTSTTRAAEMTEMRKPKAAATPVRVVQAPIATEKPPGSDGPEDASGQVQKLTVAPGRLPMAAPPALPAEIAAQPLGRSPAENVLRAIDAMMPEIARSQPTPLSISPGRAEAGSPADPRSTLPPGMSLAAVPAVEGSPADHSMAEADPILDVRSEAAPAGPERAQRDAAASEAFASRPVPRDPVEQLRPILSQLNTGTTEIRLSPEELGPLRMEVSTEGEKLTVVLSAERSETLELVRRNLDRLLSDLRNAGFSQIDLGFGRWSGGNTQEHAPSGGTAAEGVQEVDGEPASAPSPVNPIQRPDGGLYLRI